MNSIVKVNEAPARYRRDLRGADLAYEFFLVMDKMKVGDVLTIPNKVFVDLDGHVVTPPPYPHTRWRDESEHCMRLRRDG